MATIATLRQVIAVVVHQGLALKERDQAAGRPNWAIVVAAMASRRHDGTQGKCHRKAHRQDQPRDQADAQGSDDDEQHRKLRDGSTIRAEVDDRGPDGCGVGATVESQATPDQRQLRDSIYGRKETPIPTSMRSSGGENLNRFANAARQAPWQPRPGC